MFRIFSIICIVATLTSCSSREARPEESSQPEVMIDSSSMPSELKAGDICTVDNGDSTFGVVKILVVNQAQDEIHIKIYSNGYKVRPKSIHVRDLHTAGVGKTNKNDSLDNHLSIGHTPLQYTGFINWKPEVIAHQAVTEAEMEGYKMWLNR